MLLRTKAEVKSWLDGWNAPPRPPIFKLMNYTEQDVDALLREQKRGRRRGSSKKGRSKGKRGSR